MELIVLPQLSVAAISPLPLTIRCMYKMCLQAKTKKSGSRGGTPSSADDASAAASSNRPRANSYSGENVVNRPVDASPSPNYNETSDTRHSADVFHPMESNSLKLNLPQVHWDVKQIILYATY